MHPLVGRVLRSPVLPPALLGVVLASDALQSRLPFDVLRNGLLDEPAHLATSGLVLGALLPASGLQRAAVPVLAALAGSVLIDVDHVPLYLGVPHVADPGGRPYSHSLLTVLLLLAAGAALPRRRAVLSGLGAGVALHFVRDVATGPGVALLWPVHRPAFVEPYAGYAALLLVLAAAGALRRRAEGSPVGSRG